MPRRARRATRTLKEGVMDWRLAIRPQEKMQMEM
jgi:hypothetical protein